MNAIIGNDNFEDVPVQLGTCPLCFINMMYDDVYELYDDI